MKSWRGKRFFRRFSSSRFSQRLSFRVRQGRQRAWRHHRCIGVTPRVRRNWLRSSVALWRAGIVRAAPGPAPRSGPSIRIDLCAQRLDAVVFGHFHFVPIRWAIANRAENGGVTRLSMRVVTGASVTHAGLHHGGAQFAVQPPVRLPSARRCPSEATACADRQIKVVRDPGTGLGIRAQGEGRGLRFEAGPRPAKAV